MADERKVVWVLGAGFSAGLGGPLLQNLLSDASEGDIRVRYNDRKRFLALHSPNADYVRTLYRRGRTNGVIRMPGVGETTGELMWANAEEFIDYLDTAAERRESGAANPHADRLHFLVEQFWNVKVAMDDLRATARHLIAAECCAFLESVDPRREQWTPFRKWARSLTKHDTIVTFNYDRVLELLRDTQNEDAARHRGLPGSCLHVVAPAEADDAEAWSGSTPVFKLHGSVDWQKHAGTPNDVVVPSRDPLFAISCRPSELAIATPGPSKTREAKGFKALWDRAKAALAEADVVVFVGFRFPETDADPREALLGAMGKRRGAARTTLNVHVVLGYPGAHTARLEALLHFACDAPRNEIVTANPAAARIFGVKIHPLFAQDFFSVATREDL